jgi:BMFP domain-containing protein YqiC
MQTRNPMFDDLARLMTGAAGAMQAAGEEVRTLMRSHGDRLAGDLDLARREEVAALKAVAAEALTRVEALEKELAELKSALNRRLNAAPPA